MTFTGIVDLRSKSSLGVAKSLPTGSLFSDRDEHSCSCHSPAFLFSSRPARTQMELDRGHTPEAARKHVLFNSAQSFSFFFFKY